MRVILWGDGDDGDAQAGRLADRWAQRNGLRPVVEAVRELRPITGEEAATVFVIPTMLEYGLYHRERLGEFASLSRRDGHTVLFDEPDPSDPLVIQACAERAMAAMVSADVRPNEAGLILLADGRGDSRTRAGSYQVMRLLWEQLGVSEAEVAFRNHDDRSLDRLHPRLAAANVDWLVVPQTLGDGEVEELRTQLASAPGPAAFHWCEPTGGQDAVAAWVEKRAARLWEGYRKRESRVRSARKTGTEESTVYGQRGTFPVRELGGSLPPEVTFGGDAVVGQVNDAEGLAPLLAAFGIDDAGPVLVKVTWHGYATGTYTDPVALDRLLSALPGRAILLEGHTIGKNRSDGVDWDWEADSRTHRDWVLSEERAFLAATGLQEVIDRHRATYVNVTEAAWDGQCAGREEVVRLLASRGVAPRVPEVCDAIPAVLLEHLDRPLISFARFKGPTRLSVSNLFGMLPGPYRGAFHGPDLTHFARVCCEVGRVYGTLFRPFGLNEAFNVAVRWNREGLYRSRWGQYDLVPGAGAMTMSRGFAGADYLACRLQGHDTRRSAFHDTVEKMTGSPRDAYLDPLPARLVTRFA